MAGRPVCLLIFLMPSPRIELQLVDYITLESVILFESAKEALYVWNFVLSATVGIL